jgi:hypothetical protein
MVAWRWSSGSLALVERVPGGLMRSPPPRPSHWRNMQEPNMEGYQSAACWDGFRSKDAFARAGLGRCWVLDKSGPAADSGVGSRRQSLRFQLVLARLQIFGRTSTGRARRPPPKELLARSISPKKTMTSFGSVPAACRRVTIAARSERFLASSVPDESRASIIRTCSLRGFCRSG